MPPDQVDPEHGLALQPHLQQGEVVVAVLGPAGPGLPEHRDIRHSGHVPLNLHTNFLYSVCSVLLKQEFNPGTTCRTV